MIIFVGSPWQAILAKSYVIGENVNSCQYFIEKSNDKSYDQIIKILNINESFEKIAFVFDWVDFAPLNIGKINRIKRNLNKLKIDICNHVSSEETEVLVFSENNVLFQMYFSLFGKSKKIFKMEDGVLDYLENLKKDNLLKIVLKKILLQKHSFLYSYKNYFENFDKVIMLSKHVNVPNQKYVDLIKYREIMINCINLVYQDVHVLNSDGKVLLLTQSLSEDGVINENAEIEMYENILKSLQQDNLIGIIKPHPRSSSTKMKKLNFLCEKYKCSMYLNYGTPAEAIILHNSFKAVVGVYSNTIIYSQKLFGIKSYTALDNSLISMMNKKNRKQFKYIKSQVEFYFSIEELSKFY